MNSPGIENRSDVAEFLRRYDRWREMYARAGIPAPQAPVWEGDRLLLREGYPYEGWSAYAIQPEGGRYAVRHITTERLVEPRESVRGYFSDFGLAGRYIIWKIGGALRVSCRVTPLRLLWEPQSLAPGVKSVQLAKYETRYELVDDPSTYLVIKAGGIQPENRLLTLTYDELDQALEAGLTPTVTGE